MEDLTKHQLILLVLLITFVTSIGTSIISFSLIQEAPVEVTQTINRVVEKTIERVVTEPGEPEKVVTTVVVSEEDRVVEAISKNEKSIVRLKTTRQDGSEVVSGMGLVIADDGTIMAEAGSYSTLTAYSIVFSDGTVFPIGKVFIDDQNDLVFIKPNSNQSPDYKFVSVKIGDSSTLKIGQSIVAVSGRESNSVHIGRISQLSLGNDGKTVSKIDSDIPVIRNFPGSIILNLSGEVVGFEEQVQGATNHSYIPVNLLKEAKTKGLAEIAK